MSRHLIRVVLLVLAALPLAPAAAQPKERDVSRTNPAIMSLFRTAIAQSSESTVLVRGDGKDLCLGVVVGADGHILTKVSELRGPLVVRLKDGRQLPAVVIGAHEPTDLALLKIDAKKLKPIEWTDSTVSDLGAWVASPGLGNDPLAVGVVSVTSRKMRGGPPPRAAGGGYLGISLDPDAENARVAQVLEKTPAQKAGMKADDVVLLVDKTKVANADALIQLLQKYKPGDTVIVTVKRDDQEMDLKVTLAPRPSNRADFQNRLGSELSERRTGFPVILQHDSVLRARDCGGPLVDLEGRVLGINVSRAGRTETYAIPAEAIKPLIPDLIAGKFPPPQELLEPTANPLTEAKAAVTKAEADLRAIETRLADLLAAIRKAQDEPNPTEKMVAQLKAAVQKVEAEKAAVDKRLAEARSALAKAEADAKKE